MFDNIPIDAEININKRDVILQNDTENSIDGKAKHQGRPKENGNIISWTYISERRLGKHKTHRTYRK